MNSTAAGNISLNEIFKKGALVVKRTFVHLMKCVQVQKNATDVSGNNLSDWLHFFASTVVLRIPLFKNFVKPLSVTCNPNKHPANIQQTDKINESNKII